MMFCMILAKGVGYFCYKSATWISNLRGYQLCVSVGHFCCAISTSYDLLSKRGFCFCLWRCSALPSPFHEFCVVMSTFLNYWLSNPSLLTELSSELLGLAQPRLLMAVKDKYIPESNQKKKQCSVSTAALWVKILSERVFHFHALAFSREIQETFHILLYRYMKIEEISCENESEWK